MLVIFLSGFAPVGVRPVGGADIFFLEGSGDKLCGMQQRRVDGGFGGEEKKEGCSMKTGVKGGGSGGVGIRRSGEKLRK